MVCVSVSGAFVCFCRVGWKPRVGWWPRFCLVFRGSKGTVRHPGRAAPRLLLAHEALAAWAVALKSGSAVLSRRPTHLWL